MAIARQRRRPLSYKGREFVWDANDEWTIRVASVDKKLSVAVPVLFLPWEPHSLWPEDSIPVYVSGPELPGLQGRKDVWLRCRAIRKCDVRTTPGFVATLLDWCFSEEKTIEVLAASSPASTA